MRISRFSVFLSAAALLMASAVAQAQQNADALAGQWQGSYTPKAEKGPGSTRSRELGSTRGTTKVPVLVTIMPGADGKLTGTWTGTAQQGTKPIDVAIDGDTIRLTMAGPPPASWEGKLSADGSKLDGTWQGKTFAGDASAALVLRRPDTK
jgi:hypothetical protein